jgi:hypothetical protein
MAQVFIVDGNSIKMNGQQVTSDGLVTAVALSTNAQTLYVASSFYVRKYNKSYDDNDLEIWTLDDKFIDPCQYLSQYPTGLLVIGSDLYIALANTNSSSILKIDAKTGSQYYSAQSGLNISEIYSSTTEGLTAMATDDTYLYVANTGNENKGSSIVRVNLADNSVVKDFVNLLQQAPNQLQVHNNKLYILQGVYAHINSEKKDKLITIVNLEKLAHSKISANVDSENIKTFTLPNSLMLNLGLSLQNSTLKFIDNKNTVLYSIDLTASVPVVVSVPVPAVPVPAV